MSVTTTDAPTHASQDALSWIEDAQAMRPFLMSLVSDTDLWMFISSSGGVTCGRMDADHALFPYEVEDKLHQAGNRRGGYTLIRALRPGQDALWEPWTEYPPEGEVRRRLGKDPVNHRLVFEERHQRYELLYRQEWTSCERFGFVRTVALQNLADRPQALEVLDGLLDLVPWGIPANVKALMSQLVHAYTRCEIDPTSGVGIFTLQSMISDTPEPGEALRANWAWQLGMRKPVCFLSRDPIVDFRAGRAVRAETDLKGRNAHYLAVQRLELGPGETHRWRIVADVHRDQCELAELERWLQSHPDAWSVLDQEIQRSREGLRRIVAMADGRQRTVDLATVQHHQANVLFNVMRGGVFIQGYTIDKEDLAAFIRTRNPELLAEVASWLKELPSTIDWPALRQSAGATGNLHLRRLVHEYLPLYFGRRHGDPSRPWNRFRIDVKTEDGRKIFNYQGNWRDIFQNWEALCWSFPEFFESVIVKFLNASTADGFNPFRVTRDGIEWEAPEEHDLGGTIGYWGDHQIIYLTRLLEWSLRFHPGQLASWLDIPMFVYAEVPYRFKSHQEIVQDARQSMWFDAALHRRVLERSQQMGTDGRLLQAGGQIVTATMAEKILIPLLAKLSNFVPDGGIWMNTQRPEWNDSNNALAGYGLSVVTLCYLRRHLKAFRELLASSKQPTVRLAEQAALWLQRTWEIFAAHQPLLAQSRIDDAGRREMIDALGRSFEQYREAIRRQGLGEAQHWEVDRLLAWIDLVLPFIERAIRHNRRPDGLYHAYNVVRFGPGVAAILHLDLMLEGQVAALSSGCLSAQEQGDLLEALFSSRLYRADQKSFLLSPNRELADFRRRNLIPQEQVQAIQLLRELIRAGDRSVVRRDAHGQYRFHPDFRNQRPLRAALEKLGTLAPWQTMVAQDMEKVVDLYNQVFDHHRFVGRSGAIYGYEGLGCIYWHMVSKLLLATGEAVMTTESGDAQRRLVDFYWKIRGGLSACKTPQEYGAFPSDPYSHTPAHSGAQQPGMTGQVKEEILARWLELGVTVEGGQLVFGPRLLRKAEFCTQPTQGTWFDREGREQPVALRAGELFFTVCQVPVIYQVGDAPLSIQVHCRDGKPWQGEGRLPADLSGALFQHTGQIREIRVNVPFDRLCF